MPAFNNYLDLISHLRSRGHRLDVLGCSPDGSPLVAVRAGGDKLPAIVISAGSHATEQAGVTAAVELIDDLETQHQVYVLPCRDPMGLTGFEHVLGLALGETPSLHSEVEMVELLRSAGDVLYEEGETLVSLIGEYGYSTRGLYNRFQKGEAWLAPLVGRRIFFPSLYDDVEHSGPFERAYSLIVTPDGEILHINRFHDTAWAPVESRCIRKLMSAASPGITFDLHEYHGDSFWVSAREQRTDEGNEWEERIARETVRTVAAAGANMPSDEYLPGSFFTTLEPGAFWLHASQRGEGLNLSDFAAAEYGLAYTVETGMQDRFDDRVKYSKLAVQTAVRLFESRDQ